MWRVLGLQLGIHEAILSAIERKARKKRSILSKPAIEMFRLWLDGTEGTGNKDRSWSTILKALIEVGRSEVSIKVLKHFDPAATLKDIGRGEDVCVCTSVYVCTLCTFCVYLFICMCVDYMWYNVDVHRYNIK